MRRKQDVTVLVPRPAPGMFHRRERRRRTAGRVDPLQLVVGKETNGLAVGSPEGEGSALGARQRLRGQRGKGPDPELNLAGDGGGKHQSETVGGDRERARMARWGCDDLPRLFLTVDLVPCGSTGLPERRARRCPPSQRPQSSTPAARGVGPARPRSLRRHRRAADAPSKGGGWGCLTARSMAMRASPMA